MNLKVFSIFDNATKAYNNPFFMLTKAEAIRAFINMAMDDTTNIAKHPHDYNLYLLGNFDNVKGEFKEEIENIGSAVTLYKTGDEK